MKKKEFETTLSPEMQAKKDAFMKDYDGNTRPSVDVALVPGTITNDGIIRADGSTEPFSVVPRREVETVEEKDHRVALVKAKICPNCTTTEFELLMYMAGKYNLDPLLRQIWAVKFGDSPAQIYAGRDGFLEIAHRSGHFDGMETVVNWEMAKDTKGLDYQRIKGATCTVWRNDMTHPFTSNVLFSEYNTGKSLWTSKPAVMIGKVAESVCLRKAFSVSGLYSPEEMG
jgi:phage recombination protein Bet